MENKNAYVNYDAERAAPHFSGVQLHLLTPRPERLRKYWQKAPFLSDPYLSVGAKQSVQHFIIYTQIG
ncbi:hypothetical protein [Metabacillus idriensis]|uniref:hypothetical protein n=1 Tax=Metabacillus idriensis TaxID=324768 RepID=UPI00174E88AB|nr:hypothetical protein [Metabacillus idriensis]